jgi:hypothetical protein
MALNIFFFVSCYEFIMLCCLPWEKLKIHFELVKIVNTSSTSSAMFISSRGKGVDGK